MTPRIVAWAAFALAALTPPPAVCAQAELEAAEERFEILLADFGEAIQAAAGDSAVGEVAVMEAETIARVAEELLEEGEPAIAVDLLAEALALLGPSSSPPDSSGD